jgi:NADP-dependent 3-hydroxy acid dehydrogenase YdfG
MPRMVEAPPQASAIPPVLITGGASGLGLATVRALAAAGASIFLVPALF